MVKILFVVVLMFPGKQPQPFSMEVPTVQACMSEMQSFLIREKPWPDVLDGAQIEAGCVLQFSEKSKAER